MINAINKSGLASIIESVYIKEPLISKVSKSNILVNPKIPQYVIDKTVIINTSNYKKKDLDLLIDNGNYVISRVKLTNDKVHFEPYIERIDFGLMWNGDFESYPVNKKEFYKVTEMELFKWLDSMLGDEIDSFSGVRGGDMKENSGVDGSKNTVLFFPKILNVPTDVFTDRFGNLNAIGWASHQVGVNVGTVTKYKNLDLYKVRKLDKKTILNI